MSAAMAEKLSIEQIRGRLTPVFEKYGVRRAVLGEMKEA